MEQPREEMADFLISVQALWNHPIVVTRRADPAVLVIPHNAPDLTQAFLKKLSYSRSLGIISLDEGLLLGYLLLHDEEETCIAAGPIRITELTGEQASLRLRHALGIPADRQNALTWLTQGSYKTLADIMVLLAGYFCHIRRDDAMEMLLSSEKLTQDTSRKALDYSEEGPASSDYRINYEVELLLFDAVKKGNVEDVQRFTGALFQRDNRLIHRTLLHQLKALCICVVTLATRAAIAGGMGYQDAYNLSDAYIASIEYIEDDTSVINTIIASLNEFTRRVNACAAASHRNIQEYLRWIRDHIYEDITVTGMSEQLHISVSQLERIFAAEVGFTPSQFIRRCRLEESCQLLLYSSRSVTEISALLHFSSASHFIRAFSKQYKITPAKYRLQG